MTQAWANPATWTQQQWLAVCILLFVVIAIFYLTYRLYTIILMSGKSTYKPNLRRVRNARPNSHASESDAAPDK